MCWKRRPRNPSAVVEMVKLVRRVGEGKGVGGNKLRAQVVKPAEQYLGSWQPSPACLF